MSLTSLTVWQVSFLSPDASPRLWNVIGWYLIAVGAREVASMEDTELITMLAERLPNERPITLHFKPELHDLDSIQRRITQCQRWSDTETEVGIEASACLGRLGDLFAAADTSGDGELDHSELASLLQRYHKEVEKVARPLKRIHAEVEAAMGDFDTDGQGSLDFWEFVRMVCDPAHREDFRLQVGREALVAMQSMCLKGQAQEHVSALGRLFNEADTSGDGSLDRTELAAVLQRYHKEVEKVARPLKRIQTEVDAVMSHYDSGEEGVGCVSFWEFAMIVFGEAAFRFRMLPPAVREEAMVICRKERGLPPLLATLRGSHGESGHPSPTITPASGGGIQAPWLPLEDSLLARKPSAWARIGSPTGPPTEMLKPLNAPMSPRASRSRPYLTPF